MNKKLMHPNRRVAQPRKLTRTINRKAARIAARNKALRRSAVDKARGCC